MVKFFYFDYWFLGYWEWWLLVVWFVWFVNCIGCGLKNRFVWSGMCRWFIRIWLINLVFCLVIRVLSGLCVCCDIVILSSLIDLSFFLVRRFRLIMVRVFWWLILGVVGIVVFVCLWWCCVICGVVFGGWCGNLVSKFGCSFMKRCFGILVGFLVMLCLIIWRKVFLSWICMSLSLIWFIVWCWFIMLWLLILCGWLILIGKDVLRVWFNIFRVLCWLDGVLRYWKFRMSFWGIGRRIGFLSEFMVVCGVRLRWCFRRRSFICGCC